jgi:hypothetical protein
MKKVIPTKSTERELVKFWKAVDELECQPDNHRFDHILSDMLQTPTHPSGGVSTVPIGPVAPHDGRHAIGTTLRWLRPQQVSAGVEMPGKSKPRCRFGEST